MKSISDTIRFTDGVLYSKTEVITYKDGRYYTSEMPSLELVSQGDDEAEALKNIEHLFIETIRDMLERGVLDNYLNEMDWSKNNSIHQSRPRKLNGSLSVSLTLERELTL